KQTMFFGDSLPTQPARAEASLLCYTISQIGSIESRGSMNTKEEILTRLRQTEGYLSGEQLSETLGVSRAAVWKAITALRESGYAIDSATNRGYRLSASPEVLTP